MSAPVDPTQQPAVQATETTVHATETTVTAEPAEPAAAAAAAATSAEEGRRLYIGNLAYAVTSDQLKDFFKDYSVESTSIPVNPRTSRPVGYAFVDLASVDQANAAIEALSGKDILDRKVSVQFARKPDENKDGDNNQDGRKRGQGRSRGRGRGRGGRFTRNGRRQQGEPATDGLQDVSNADTTGAANAPAPELKEPANAAKPRRQPKHRGPPEDGIPSKTKVMVANLPYDLSEEKLKDLFAAYQPVSSKIALRPIPRFMVKKLQARNEPRKGRGFGFVTLASEDLQQKAVAEMNGKEVEGREIAVKVAIDSPGKEDDAENKEEEEEEKEKKKKENGETQAQAQAQVNGNGEAKEQVAAAAA